MSWPVSRGLHWNVGCCILKLIFSPQIWPEVGLTDLLLALVLDFKLHPILSSGCDQYPTSGKAEAGTVFSRPSPAFMARRHGVAKSQTRLSDWTELRQSKDGHCDCWHMTSLAVYLSCFLKIHLFSGIFMYLFSHLTPFGSAGCPLLPRFLSSSGKLGLLCTYGGQAFIVAASLVACTCRSVRDGTSRGYQVCWSPACGISLYEESIVSPAWQVDCLAVSHPVSPQWYFDGHFPDDSRVFIFH